MLQVSQRREWDQHLTFSGHTPKYGNANSFAQEDGLSVSNYLAFRHLVDARSSETGQ